MYNKILAENKNSTHKKIVLNMTGLKKQDVNKIEKYSII